MRAERAENLDRDLVNPAGIAVARGDDRKDRYQKDDADAFEGCGNRREGCRSNAAQPGETGKIPHEGDRLLGKIRLRQVGLGHLKDYNGKRGLFPARAVARGRPAPISKPIQAGQ